MRPWRTAFAICALAGAVAVAADAPRFASFGLCYLDVHRTPQRLQPDPGGRRRSIAIASITEFSDISAQRSGIACAKIITGGRTLFVVGTMPEVCAKLGVDPADPVCRVAAGSSERKVRP